MRVLRAAAVAALLLVSAVAVFAPWWAYDRHSHVGKLDKALDEAAAKGWTVVDMKTDWKQVFPTR
jgi:hypothetical protein